MRLGEFLQIPLHASTLVRVVQDDRDRYPTIRAYGEVDRNIVIQTGALEEWAACEITEIKSENHRIIVRIAED